MVAYNIGFFIGFAVVFTLLYILPTYIVSRLLTKVLTKDDEKKPYVIANIASMLICTALYTMLNLGDLPNIMTAFIAGLINYVIVQAIWLLKDYIDNSPKYKHTTSNKVFKNFLTASYVKNANIRNICLIAGIVIFLFGITQTYMFILWFIGFYIPYILACGYQFITGKSN